MALLQRCYRRLVGSGRAPDEDTELGQPARSRQPQNFLIHAASLTATKLGDGLSDPKLVLSWLLGALGAPLVTLALLVPVREAGALLPQVWLTGWVERATAARWVWSVGALGQGLCVFGMAAAARLLDGAAAGWTIVGLLAGFSLSRSVCSVSYKHVQGRTLVRSTRGTATGTADSIAALGVLAFGLALAFDVVPRTPAAISGALALAGLLWCLAALTFSRLTESGDGSEDAQGPARTIRERFALILERPQLGRFIAVRGLLIATALAPPYLVALSGRTGGRALGDLGPFVVASACASVLSGYVWGRLADRSSRRALMASGLLASATLALTGLLAAGESELLDHWSTLPLLLFALQIAYRGVRLGRSTHLVDMAPAADRAAYTAVSNTAIGVLLMLGGALGALGAALGEAPLLALFCLLCLAAAWVARGLEEVQQGGSGLLR